MWKLFHKRPLTRLGMLAKVKIRSQSLEKRTIFLWDAFRLGHMRASFSLWTPIHWTRMKFISTEIR